MKFKSYKNRVCSFLIMAAIGLATAIASTSYGIGSLRHMGPGYYPLGLGVALVVVALLILITDDQSDHNSYKPVQSNKVGLIAGLSKKRGWLCVVGAVVSFIVLGKYGGLVPATFTMVVLAALGDSKNTIFTAVVSGVVVTLMAVGIFHFGLNMQFPLFKWG